MRLETKKSITGLLFIILFFGSMALTIIPIICFEIDTLFTLSFLLVSVAFIFFNGAYYFGGLWEKYDKELRARSRQNAKFYWEQGL